MPPLRLPVILPCPHLTPIPSQMSKSARLRWTLAPLRVKYSTRAPEVLELLQMNEGNNSGRGIGCISWDGSVHADQFWRHYSFGNVTERKFSQIWTDLSNPLMKRLKNKKLYVKGRCADCKWLSVCGGNFRVRAEAATGDLWSCDPARYLSDEEIAKAG